MLEGFPGPPGPAKPQKRTPKKLARLPTGTQDAASRVPARNACVDGLEEVPVLRAREGGLNVQEDDGRITGSASREGIGQALKVYSGGHDHKIGS